MIYMIYTINEKNLIYNNKVDLVLIGDTINVLRDIQPVYAPVIIIENVVPHVTVFVCLKKLKDTALYNVYDLNSINTIRWWSSLCKANKMIPEFIAMAFL